ncbi:response regulator [Phormidesmis priestleyi]
MKILLIEDDEHTSQLLSATLSAHRYAVDAIADGAAGLELAAHWSYDLILLDVLLPKLNGIEVCRHLRAQNCQTPILMLTVKDSDEDVIAGLDAGADDYVAKSCAPAQLRARVRALLRRGENAASSPVLTWGLLCLDPALVQVAYDQKTIALRSKEYSLLELFLRHPQHILSRSAIIDHLWSIDETPVEGSVTNLIKDLRQRLKSAGMDADLIETVYGLGYRLKTAPAEPEQTLTREDDKRADHASKSALTVDWEVHEQRGRTAIQQITERFRVSLEQRIAVLEAAERSLEAGNFSLAQHAATRTEAHKLAGGLGTFGCVEASETAQAIEHLLHQVSQEPQFTGVAECRYESLSRCTLGSPLNPPFWGTSELLKSPRMGGWGANS